MSAAFTQRPIANAIAAFPILPSEASAASMFKAFASIDGLLRSLESGEVDVEAGVPVMLDWEGGWCEIAPALHGWCDCWERIAQRMGDALDLGHLRRLANRLSSGMLLTLVDVARARTIVDRCRALYLACPPTLRAQAVLVEMVAVALDEAGLRKAA